MAETPLYYYTRRKLQRKIKDSSENPDKNDVEDRLSSLPDTIVVEILSLLPLKSAAATSVMSHRWRHIWTQLPHLFFEGDTPPWRSSRWPANSKQYYIRIKTIVNHILKQITSPHIHTFNLVIPCCDTKSRLCQATLKSSIRFLCTRNVAAIKVITWSDNLHKVFLPTCIFEIKSLVQLHLGGGFRYKLPEIKKGMVSLPNLKKLILSHNPLDDLQKLGGFINSCPILELLSLKFPCYFPDTGDVYPANGDVIFLNISSPMLKSFITKGTHEPMVKFVIDAPMLQHLALDGGLGNYSFVQYPSKLVKAEICITSFDVWEDWEISMDIAGKILSLVRGISGVESVSLGYEMGFFKVVDYLGIDAGSIFSNLTHLRLSTLAVDMDLDEYDPIPLYLLSKLKRLEIMKMMGNANNVKLLRYILSEANLLERLYLTTVRDYFGFIYPDCDEFDDFDDDDEKEEKKKNKLWFEYQMYKTFLDVPRSSLPSEIEFVGMYICVSSNSSQNGLILTSNDQTRKFW